MAKIIISRKHLTSFKKFRKKVIEPNPKLAKAANRRSEQEELYNELKETPGSLTASKLGKVFGDLKYGNDDHFNKEEAVRSARALGVNKIYKSKKDKKNSDELNQKTDDLKRKDDQDDRQKGQMNEDRRTQRSDFASQKESSGDKSADDNKRSPIQNKSIYNFLRRF